MFVEGGALTRYTKPALARAQVGVNGLVKSSSGLTVPQSGVTVGTGLVVNGGVDVESGDVSISAGPVSVVSSSTTADTVSVSTTSTSYAGNAIMGRVAAGVSAPAAVATFLEGANLLFQVLANGQATSGNGVLVSNGGLTLSGGLNVATNANVNSGAVLVSAGALSVVSSRSSIAANVYTSSASFSGNTILGRLPSAATANAMTLLEGTNVLFQVRHHTRAHGGPPAGPPYTVVCR